MTTEPEDRGTWSAMSSERRLLEEAQRALCRVFPSLPVDQVSVVVECIWAEYDDALVRDFVPPLSLCLPTARVHRGCPTQQIIRSG